MKTIVISLLSCLALFLSTVPGYSAVFNISSGNVAGLIAAINAANSNGEENTINLAPGTYTLTSIDNSALPEDSNGLPVITSAITISGQSAETTIIERSSPGVPPDFRILQISGAGKLSIKALTIRGGSFNESGGGIRNSGNLTVTDSIIEGNRGRFGGGIFNSGTLEVSRTHVRFNAANVAGGIDNEASGQATIVSSSIMGNGALASGGFANGGIATIHNSTISDNGAESGAGVVNAGSMVISNTTVAGNRASFPPGFGGGVSNGGDLKILNSTISHNRSGSSGGIDNSGKVELQNTIVALNTLNPFPPSSGGPDCVGPITSLGHNIIGTTAGCTITLQSSDQIADPQLRDFLDPGSPGNGRFPLRSDSPAIDAGDTTACAALATDQLGQPRSVAGSVPLDGPRICDIGAVEFFLPVNDLVQERESERVTQFDPTPAPGAPAGTFLIIAKFDNISDTSPPGPPFANKTIFFPFFEVAAIQLSRAGAPPEDQPVLLNADRGPGRDGARLTPQGSLTTPFPPGATGAFQFRIGLQKREPFVFFVNMLGEPRSSSSSVSMR